MPCRFRYIVSRRLLIQHFTGTIGLPEVLAHYDRVLCHPALPMTALEMTDMRGITALSFDARPLSSLVTMLSSEYVRRHAVFQRGAVLVGAGPGEFAARLFLGGLQPSVQSRYAIFRETAAAVAWLNLSARQDKARRTPRQDCPALPPTRPPR